MDEQTKGAGGNSDGRARAELFAKGVGLFNDGAYWEAHEAWEEIWKSIPGPERRFFQGLIQAAAAFHQWRRRRMSGAVEHFRRAATKLAPFPERWMEIELGDFRRRLNGWRELAARGEPFPEPPRIEWVSR